MSALHVSSDPRVGIASRSALAALQPSAPQPSALQQSAAPKQTADAGEQAQQLVAALTELGNLRSEMAALQAALTTLKGSQVCSGLVSSTTSQIEMCLS